MPVRQGGSGLGGQFSGVVRWQERPATQAPVLPVPAKPDLQGVDDLYGVWINHANTRVVQLDRQRFAVGKLPNASGVYDSDAYSPMPLTGDFVLKVDVPAFFTADGVFGLATDPLTASDDTNMPHRIRAQSGSQLAWWKSGVLSGGFISATAPYWIYRIAGTIYFASGPTAGTIHDSIVDGATYYADSSYAFDQFEYEANGGHVVSIYNGTLVTTIATSMAADVGIFTYSGQTAQLEQGYAMAAGLGTFTYSGQAALLERGYIMPAVLGTFSYSGQAAATLLARPMAAGLGTFSYTGQAAALGQAFTMSAGLGTYTYNGQSALLTKASVLAAAMGTFGYTGQAAITNAAYKMPAALGTFTYSGQTALLGLGTTMAGALGTFSYTGQAITLSRAYLMSAALGTYTYTGQSAVIGISASLIAALGSFSYTGQPSMATISYGSVPPAGGGATKPRVTTVFFG